MKEKNPDHKKHIHRINRVKGQLDGVAKMIEDNRYCLDILQQTKAIKSAIQSLEAILLESHLNHCVKNAFTSKSKVEQENKVAELIKIYLKNI